jgi:predicted PurR-regulated permease PerM
MVAMSTVPRPPSLRHDIAAWVIAACLLVLTLYLHLLPALLTGLLVYELVHVIAGRLPVRSGPDKVMAVALLGGVVVAVLTLAMFGAIAFLQSDTGSFAKLLQKLADIIEGSRGKLPSWLVGALPGDAESLQAVITQWLREHSTELRIFGGEVGHAIVFMLIGMVIGAMVALREGLPAQSGGPLAVALAERASRLGEAFRLVVFAQVRISALNTLLTAIYLLVILPLLGIHLPFAKTLVASGRDRVAAVPRRRAQARVFPQRAHRRPPHPRESLGASRRHAAHGGGIRNRRPYRRADLLRVSQGRARRARADLSARAVTVFAARGASGSSRSSHVTPHLSV